MNAYSTNLKHRLALVLVGILCLIPGRLLAQGVVYFQTEDLPDEVLGQDLWEYTYQLNGFGFQSGEGFSVYFDHLLYANLHGAEPALSSLWDILVVQPDVFLAQPGLFDALALVNGPSMSVPFKVRFIWLGPSSPGAQPFEQYNSSFQPIATGQSVVPEPQSLSLLSGGVLAWLWSRRIKAGCNSSIA